MLCSAVGQHTYDVAISQCTLRALLKCYWNIWLPPQLHSLIWAPSSPIDKLPSDLWRYYMICSCFWALWWVSATSCWWKKTNQKKSLSMPQIEEWRHRYSYCPLLYPITIKILTACCSFLSFQPLDYFLTYPLYSTLFATNWNWCYFIFSTSPTDSHKKTSNEWMPADTENMERLILQPEMKRDVFMERLVEYTVESEIEKPSPSPCTLPSAVPTNWLLELKPER